MLKRHENLRSTMLENGLRIITDCAAGFQSAATTIAFNVGSALETPEDNGIAHLLEHVVFRGSETRSSADIRGQFTAMGGYVNATTDQDTTAFDALTLREDVGAAIRTIADFVIHPALRVEDIEQEKEIIAHESCRGCANCSLRDAFYESAFPGQGLSLPTIGSEESCKAIDRDALAAFHARYYVASNLVVAVVGDVNHDEIVGTVADAFSQAPAGRPADWPQYQYYGGESVFGAGGDQGSVWYGYPAPAGNTVEGYAARLFHDHLGYGPGSRLFEELREKRGLVYCVDSSIAYHARRPIAITAATGEAKKITEIFEIILHEIGEAAEKFSDADVERVRNQRAAGTRMGMDVVSNRCNWLILETFEYGEPVTLDQSLAMLGQVDAETVRNVAAKMLSQPPTLAAFGPVRKLPRLPGSEAHARKGFWRS